MFRLKGSLLDFVSQVHLGVKGVVFMPDGRPAKFADIGKERTFFSSLIRMFIC